MQEFVKTFAASLLANLIAGMLLLFVGSMLVGGQLANHRKVQKIEREAESKVRQYRADTKNFIEGR